MLQRQIPIEELSRKLKPIFGKKIDELYFKYSVANSLEEKNQILQILTSLYQKNLSKLLDQNILLEPPKEHQISGKYPLADVTYAGKKLYPFALNEHDWPRHVCITGMSGSGKTTFAFNILERFIEKDKPFLVFDWKKSFRSLINIDSALMNFTIGNENVANFFKTNINIPPKGVGPKEWINVLCDLLTESFQVSFGVHKILLETLDEIYEGWGIYKKDGLKKHYPNWQHVKKMLEIKARDAKSRESTWYESALRIATVLTFGSFGKVINYDGKKAVSIEDLLDKKVIFELNSLSNIEKKFFCEYILTYLYKSKKSQQNKLNENFEYAILVDEAHNIFLKDKTHFVSESVTDMIYREMREYGISLICLDQHVSKLSDTVKGNSACHVAFQQQLPNDIHEISSLMQLWDKKEIFSKLPVGSAIVKLSERYNSPFLVDVPFVELRKFTINDEKIAQRMDFMVQSISAQKNDSEFIENITFEREIESGKWNDLEQDKPDKMEKPGFATEKPLDKTEEIAKLSEIPSISYENPEITMEITQKQDISEKLVEESTKLTQIQEILYNFLSEQVRLGRDIKDIEKVFERNISEDHYTSLDIQKVMDYFLESKEKVTILNKQADAEKEIKTEKIIEISDEILKDLNDEQKHFLNFLRQNPTHIYSTVELYKQMNFSPRKGNKLKNELLEKNLVEVQEQKNENGWKKFIRLSNSNLSIKQNNTNTISNNA